MSSSSSDAFPWIPVLTLIFIVLKLTENITWSWWWVFSPMWIGLLFGIAFLTVGWLLGQIADWRDR